MQSLRAHNVLGTITDRAVDYIEAHDGERPFFLYLPFTSPHTPIAPAPEFLGLSGVSPYGDFCVETDARVGQVLDALDAEGFAEDTLVIFTSDNGCSREPAQCDDLEARYGHRASHIDRVAQRTAGGVHPRRLIAWMPHGLWTRAALGTIGTPVLTCGRHASSLAGIHRLP